MLQMGDDDFITFSHMLGAPALGHQIDCFGGATHENDFIDIRRIEEASYAFACTFIGVGCTCRQFMRSAVDVGVFVFVERADPIDYRLWLVGRGSIVEPNQLAAVDAFLQNRKIASHGMHVEWRMTVATSQRYDSMRLCLGGCDVTAGQDHRIDEIVLRASRCCGWRSR